MKKTKEIEPSPEFMESLKNMPKPPKYNRYQKVARLCVEKLHCISLDDLENPTDRDRIVYVAGLLESLMFMDDEEDYGARLDN